MLWRHILILAVTLLCGGCSLFNAGKPAPDALVKKQLDKLQISVEKEIEEGQKAKLAVLAVVDAQRMQKPAEGEEPDPELAQQAEKRERDVRQGLSSVLVDNVLMEVLQPTADQLEQTRAALTAANSPALDAALADAMGKQLGAQYLVCALIDEGGKIVNVTAQRCQDGVVIFQDKLIDWSVAAPKTGTKPAAS